MTETRGLSWLDPAGRTRTEVELDDGVGNVRELAVWRREVFREITALITLNEFSG